MSTKKYAHVQFIFDELIRIWKVKGYHGLAEHINVPYQTLMAWKKRGSIGDYAPFMDKGITRHWLDTGEIPVFVGSEIPFVLYCDEECRHVDIYNMVEAGSGAIPEWHEPVDRRAIPTRYLSKGVRPVLVRGRSMEPTFKNGAIIGVNENDKQVIGGEAYAVLLPYEGAVVKRLYPLPDGVLIRSDNKEFPEVTLKRDEIPDFFILGRVCWVVQEV